MSDFKMVKFRKLRSILSASSFLILIALDCCLGLPSFRTRIPNGRNVVFKDEFWPAVGHNIRDEPGPSAANLNPFGKDAKDSIQDDGVPVWADFCTKDSDGDGRTNGEELGDPDCVWTVGLDDPSPPAGGVSHPGFDDEADLPEFTVEVPPAFIAHASMMLIAWLILAPLGVFMAVTQKKRKQSAFLRDCLCDNKWLTIHKSLVLSAVLLTIVAWITIFIEVGEFKTNSSHTIIGFIVVVLSLLQPLSGHFRVHIHEDGSKSKARLLWEFQHQWTGRVLLVLAFVAVFLGFKIAAEIFGYIDLEGAKVGKTIVIVLLLFYGITQALYVFLFRDEYLLKQSTSLNKQNTINEVQKGESIQNSAPQQNTQTIILA